MDSPLNVLPAPQSGPFALGCTFLANATATPMEGLWLPTGWAKTGSISIEGQMSTLSVQLWGSNLLPQPLNQYVVTITGSTVVGDTVSITFTNPNLAGTGTRQVTSAALPGSATVTQVAAALALAINTDTVMTALGFQASNVAGVLTIQYTSYPQNQNIPDVSGYNPLSNQTTITFSKTGTGSQVGTIAFGGNGNTVGSAITSLSLTTISNLPRWMTARLTTLTGGGASISASFSGSC